MKMFKILPFLLCSFVYAQPESYCSLSLGFDAKNAIVGSKPTNNEPALDLIAGLHMVSNNFELNPEFEYFKQIGFQRFGVNFAYHDQRYIPIGNNELNFTLIPSLGASLINRFNMNNISTDGYSFSSHLAVQGGLSIRFKISDHIMIDGTIQALTRSDLKFYYPNDNPKFIVFSNFINLHYILN